MCNMSMISIGDFAAIVWFCGSGVQDPKPLFLVRWLVFQESHSFEFPTCARIFNWLVPLPRQQQQELLHQFPATTTGQCFHCNLSKLMGQAFAIVSIVTFESFT